MIERGTIFEPIQSLGVPAEWALVVAPGALAFMYALILDPASRSTIVDLELFSGIALGLSILVRVARQNRIGYVRSE